MPATTVAAGCSAAISGARLGPETTTTRSGSTRAVSTITSLIRLVVPSSMPFISETSVASGSNVAGPLGEVAAQGLRRHGDRDQVGAGDRRGQVGWWR